MAAANRSIAEALVRGHVSRRSLLEFCTKPMVAAPFGLTLTDQVHATEVASQLERAQRPSVIWLRFQDCTGCTETLLRTSQPDVGTLITLNAQAPIAYPTRPLEVLRTVHSFDPCMACACHAFDPQVRPLAQVRVL